jgi:hypothetical protein
MSTAARTTSGVLCTGPCAIADMVQCPSDSRQGSLPPAAAAACAHLPVRALLAASTAGRGV